MIESNCMLTTFDNPFDPFEQFTSWFMFDTEKGYNCSSKVDRIANVTDEMSEEEEMAEIERAIDEIIKHDPFNIFKKVTQKLNAVSSDEQNT